MWDPGISVLEERPVIQVVAVAAGSPAAATCPAIRSARSEATCVLSLDQAQRLLKGTGIGGGDRLFRARI
jgi:hypothetical protein